LETHLAEKLCKLLVVEDLETAAGRDLADGCRMEAVVVVTVAALYKYAAVAEAFREHLASDVVQVNPCQHTTGVNTYRCWLWPPCIADADIIFSSCGFFFLLYFLA